MIQDTKRRAAVSSSPDTEQAVLPLNEPGRRFPNIWVARLVAAVLILTAVWLLEEEGATPLEGGGTEGAVDLLGRPAVSASGSESGPRVGKPAPDLVLQDLDGRTWQLSALRGKTVLVNFWATWCPPCRAEMPELDALYQKYGDQEVVVLGINLKEDGARVRRYSKALDITFPALLDPGGVAASRYSIVALPTTFFVDRDGVIRDINIGALSDKGLEAKLRKAME